MRGSVGTRLWIALIKWYPDVVPTSNFFCFYLVGGISLGGWFHLLKKKTAFVSFFFGVSFLLLIDQYPDNSFVLPWHLLFLFFLFRIFFQSYYSPPVDLLLVRIMISISVRFPWFPPPLLSRLSTSICRHPVLFNGVFLFQLSLSFPLSRLLLSISPMRFQSPPKSLVLCSAPLVLFFEIWISFWCLMCKFMFAAVKVIQKIFILSTWD